MIGQLFESFAEAARLLAHVHHFAEKGREEIARRGQPLVESPPLVDHVADGGQMPADGVAGGVFRLAAQAVRTSIPANREVDIRLLKAASCLNDIRELKNMMGVHRGSRVCP